MKNYLSILFLGLILITSPKAIFSYETDWRINTAMQTLNKLPEAQALINRVQSEGMIEVKLNRTQSKEFGAYWEGTARRILVNIGPNSNQGKILSSILFELHNAAADREFARLVYMAATGKLNRNEYVERVERLEHSNALKTVKLLEKGIKLGYFPSTAHWPIYKNFDDHFRLQKQTGHSHWIANRYDDIRRKYSNVEISLIQ